MDNDRIVKEISGKLSALIALALTGDVGNLNLGQKVELLSRFDIPNLEIAAILGTTKGSVEVLKSRSARKRRK
jgi:hypothetical protein